MSRVIITAHNNAAKYVQAARALKASIRANASESAKIFVVSDLGTVSRTKAMCARADLLLRALEGGCSMAAWLDCDTLVRGSLIGMWDDVGEDTIRVLYRESEDRPEFKFNSGVIVVGRGKHTRSLLLSWMKEMATDSSPLSDQRQLWLNYWQMRRKIRLARLPIKYNDCHFAADSMIWHGKGNSTYRSPAWFREYAKYVS